MGYNINEEFPSKYLRASDLKGRTITVKVGNVDRETIGNDRKLVVYFDGKEKGLVLNKTNAGVIADAYGDDTDDWRGGELELFSIMTDFQGKPVEAVRVRLPKRKPNAGNQATERPAPAPAPARELVDDDIPF